MHMTRIKKPAPAARQPVPETAHTGFRERSVI